ncbi:hypothetical protein Clo1100_2477 [Clostridium sp. BNL1100]|nr:hypothetical protein Clo1100_2477 [Clostridium sp. BNL1100]
MYFNFLYRAIISFIYFEIKRIIINFKIGVKKSDITNINNVPE